MALIFSTSTDRFHPVKFWLLSIQQENENAVYYLFGNDIIFSSPCVLVSDNSKQLMTVWFFYY